MSKSLKNIVDSVIETLSGLYPTDDKINRLDRDLIAAKVHDVRALLCLEDLKSKKYISEDWFSHICCLEIECHEVTCAGINPGIKYKYVVFPEVIGEYHRTIRYLGNEDFSVMASILPLQAYLTVDNRIYTSKEFVATIVRDSNLGLIALVKNLPEEDQKYICANAVVDDPTGICEYNDDDIYPMPMALVHKLEYVTVRHFLMALGLPADYLDDANDLSVARQPKEEKQDE